MLYNGMEQPIVYKGQLSLGDMVSLTPGRDFFFEVVGLQGDRGIVEHKLSFVVYTIKHEKGMGWLLIHEL